MLYSASIMYRAFFSPERERTLQSDRRSEEREREGEGGFFSIIYEVSLIPSTVSLQSYLLGLTVNPPGNIFIHYEFYCKN